MEDLQQHPRYEEAQRHVNNLRSFYTHAMVYALVNLGLFTVNMLSTPNRIWFAWATLGWGMGLAAHGASVLFTQGGFLGADWEQRKIREYLRRRGESVDA